MIRSRSSYVDTRRMRSSNSRRMVTNTRPPSRAGMARGSTTVRIADPMVASTMTAPQTKTSTSMNPSTGAA